jgi:riboflavin kinase/FMN adenylyltransferase
MMRSVDVIYFPDHPRPATWRAPVLALGNFDGLHRGHMKIVDRVRRAAFERRATPVALTFDPHPTRVVRPDKAPRLLMTQEQKLETFAQGGMEGVALVRFTPQLAQWSPETFVKTVLVDWLRVSEVWVGANFLFGHDRSGDFSVLRTLGARYGFRAEKIDPVRYKEFVVSSTRIRRLISEGRVDEASALLGRQFFIDVEVIAGHRRGRTLLINTVNLRTANEMVPPHGVYATVARVDSVLYASVTNIGVRPTFGGSAEPTIETHILDFEGDLYGARVRISFVQRLRDERAFLSVEALRTQIARDCAEARVLFERISV